MFQPFRELNAGRSAVLISHRFSSVRMADRILVLADGEVEASGTHATLLTAGGRYAELFKLQAAFMTAKNGGIVAIILNENAADIFNCSGSLMSDRIHILTACPLRMQWARSDRPDRGDLRFRGE